MIVGATVALVLLQPPPSGGPQTQPPAPVQLSSVQLRGQSLPLSGEVASASPAGVLLKATADDPGRLISWDRVRTVEGPGAAKAVPFLSFADGLMRARTRLERGDAWLADQAIDPLYRQAVAGVGGFAGPSGLLLAECSLRSSLARNAPAGATLAWLQWASVERSRPVSKGPTSDRGPQWVGGGTMLPPVVDASTGLCPQLPPIFPHRSASSVGTLRVLTQSAELQRLSAEGSSARALAAAYALAVRIAAGDIQPGESVALPSPSGDSEQLVIDIVAAQTAPSEPMRAARQRLQRRIEVLLRDAETRETADEGASPPDRTWQRAWLHAAIGRSMLAEDQPALRRQGMIELLHVPALDGATQPSLASTAILDVIDQLRREGGDEGNDAAIAALTSELKSRFGVDPTPIESAPVAPAPVAPPVPAQSPVEDPSTPAPSSPSKEVP
jgi:hypothetical protein